MNAIDNIRVGNPGSLRRFRLGLAFVAAIC
jgi:hypothetical protein